ncbi:hypothetical protein ACSTKD_00070, partial [Vibrio parahaemolyticus]
RLVPESEEKAREDKEKSGAFLTEQSRQLFSVCENESTSRHHQNSRHHAAQSRQRVKAGWHPSI